MALLEESGLWLENVDRIALASGNLVLKKYASVTVLESNHRDRG